MAGEIRLMEGGNRNNVPCSCHVLVFNLKLVKGSFLAFLQFSCREGGWCVFKFPLFSDRTDAYPFRKMIWKGALKNACIWWVFFALKPKIPFWNSEVKSFEYPGLILIISSELQIQIISALPSHLWKKCSI